MRVCNKCLEPVAPIEIDGTLLDHCEHCGVVEGETHEEYESPLKSLFDSWIPIFSPKQ